MVPRAKEPQKVEGKRSPPELAFISWSPRSWWFITPHPSAALPRPSAKGRRAALLRAQLPSVCRLPGDADEGSYANVCPLGRQAKTLLSLIWGPGAGRSIPFSLGLPLSPSNHLFPSSSSPNPAPTPTNISTFNVVSLSTRSLSCFSFCPSIFHE